jgi:hypothetical protein
MSTFNEGIDDALSGVSLRDKGSLHYVAGYVAALCERIKLLEKQINKGDSE